MQQPVNRVFIMSLNRSKMVVAEALRRYQATNDLTGVGLLQEDVKKVKKRYKMIKITVPDSKNFKKYRIYRGKNEFYSYLISLPKDLKVQGVYFLYFRNEVVYVGKSNNIYRRFMEHRASKRWNMYKFIPILDKTLCSITELYYINKYKPKYNIKMW